MHYYLPDGTRFEPRKKDGTKYKSIPRKLVQEAGAVMGVVDILSHAGSKGGLLNWYASMGIAAATRSMQELGNVDGNEVNQEDSKNKLNEMLHEFSDRGSMMHDHLEKGLSNTAYVPDIPAAGIAIGNVRKRIAEELGIVNPEEELRLMEEFKFERTFYANSGGVAYGGTIDAVNRTYGVIIDWKFPDKPRPPRISELAQGAAYAHAIKRVDDSGPYQFYNFYLSPHTGEITGVRLWTEHEMELGYDYFLSAYRIMQLEREIEEQIKGIED